MSQRYRDDHQMMQGIVRRDESALSALYAQYGARVYGLCMRILNNAGLAEEAAQDTFFKIWKDADKWDAQRGKLSSWILTIARFTAIDRLRKEQRQQPQPPASLEQLQFMIGQASVTRKADWVELERIKTCLPQLSEVQREALELAFFQGMTHQEMADYLNTPLGTVKSRVRSALQLLRRLLLENPSE